MPAGSPAQRADEVVEGVDLGEGELDRRLGGSVDQGHAGDLA